MPHAPNSLRDVGYSQNLPEQYDKRVKRWMARKPNLALLVWVCFASVAGKENPRELGKTPVRAKAELLFTPKTPWLLPQPLGPLC